MAKQRTTNFMFRVGDENDIEGAMKITELKSFVKAFNTKVRMKYGTSGQTLRVCLKGRKPKVKFLRRHVNPTTGETKITWRGFSPSGNVLGGRDNWGACDVYVQVRYPEYSPWLNLYSTNRSNSEMCSDITRMLHKMYNWQ